MTDRPLSAMCIDDEPMDLRLNDRLLRKCGAFETVTCFSSAEAALDYLRHAPDPQTDVIFLDINMPRMNGFEFLAAAQAELGPNFAGCVVIMLTTSLHPRDRAKAETFDIVAEYMGKPLTIEAALRVAARVRDT